MLGQEQDTLGGGFSESESFVGKLSGVNVWDAELTSAQIDDQLTNCEELAVGNVVAWPDFLGQLKGKLKKAGSNFCKGLSTCCNSLQCYIYLHSTKNKSRHDQIPLSATQTNTTANVLYVNNKNWNDKPCKWVQHI